MQETLTGFRVSPQQKQLWSRAKDGSAYRTQATVLIEGPLDVAALRTAVDQVIQRHEILRTTYHRRSGMTVPLQVVQSTQTPAWRTLDVSGLEFCAQEEKIAALFREDGSLPLDLENGPVVHLTLVTQTPCRHVLLLCLPALTADLGSIQCLVEDISRFYGESLTDGEVPDPLQYADFSEWQNQLVQADDDSAEAARDQWRQ